MGEWWGDGGLVNCNHCNHTHCICNTYRQTDRHEGKQTGRKTDRQTDITYKPHGSAQEGVKIAATGVDAAFRTTTDLHAGLHAVYQSLS